MVTADTAIENDKLPDQKIFLSQSNAWRDSSRLEQPALLLLS